MGLVPQSRVTYVPNLQKQRSPCLFLSLFLVKSSSYLKGSLISDLVVSHRMRIFFVKFCNKGEKALDLES